MRSLLRPKSARGFTMVELMIVVGIMGVIISIAVPGYQRLTARAYRTELNGIFSKARMYFINQYENTGSFPLPASGTDSTWNPIDPAASPPPGTPVKWVTDGDWKEMPGADGSVRMRYLYRVTNSGTTLQLLAQGQFPGLGAYSYSETYDGTVQTGTAEIPQF